MNNEIQQIYKKINPQNILEKRFYPVWFFTNERLKGFIKTSFNNTLQIKRIFGIGGSGDFAFNLLSLLELEIEEINLCDIRQMASLTIDLKINLFQTSNFAETLNIFLNKQSDNKIKIYQRLKQELNSVSKAVLDNIIHKSPSKNFIRALKNSGFWYKYNFGQIKHTHHYLLYLTSQIKYQFLQKQLNKIHLYYGDFTDNLKLFKHGYYDLIYTSNILDNKKYNNAKHLCLQTIYNKLRDGGFLIITTQNSSKKMRGMIENFGFQIIFQEIHRFNIFSVFLGYYCFSFILFQKKNPR